MNRYLSGNPINLLKAVKTYGGVDINRIHIFLMFLLKGIVFLPLGVIEYLFHGSQIANTKIDKPPVFILGHNRSGTTYLHKLLINDPQFGYFQNTDMLFPSVKTPFNGFLKKCIGSLLKLLKAKSFAYNNTDLILEDPQEEDMCMTAMFQSASAYWGFVFPKQALLNFRKYVYFDHDSDKREWINQYQYFIRKITLKNKGKRLLLKNPANTARVATLIKMYPDAKFLFIHRNPKRVFYSTKRIWYHAMNELGMQKIDDQAIEENIIEHYKTMHTLYENYKALIPEKHLCEISYLELEKCPLETLKRVYDQLKLGDFESVKTCFSKQLSKEVAYRKFSYQYNEKTNTMIKNKLKKYFLMWNYSFE